MEICAIRGVFTLWILKTGIFEVKSPYFFIKLEKFFVCSFCSSNCFSLGTKKRQFLIFELKKMSPSWSKKLTSRAEPSWKNFSSSYSSSQLGSGSSLVVKFAKIFVKHVKHLLGLVVGPEFPSSFFPIIHQNIRGLLKNTRNICRPQYFWICICDFTQYFQKNVRTAKILPKAKTR